MINEELKKHTYNIVSDVCNYIDSELRFSDTIGFSSVSSVLEKPAEVDKIIDATAARVAKVLKIDLAEITDELKNDIKKDLYENYTKGNKEDLEKYISNVNGKAYANLEAYFNNEDAKSNVK